MKTFGFQLSRWIWIILWCSSVSASEQISLPVGGKITPSKENVSLVVKPTDIPMDGILKIGSSEITSLELRGDFEKLVEIEIDKNLKLSSLFLDGNFPVLNRIVVLFDVELVTIKLQGSFSSLQQLKIFSTAQLRSLSLIGEFPRLDAHIPFFRPRKLETLQLSDSLLQRSPALTPVPLKTPENLAEAAVKEMGLYIQGPPEASRGGLDGKSNLSIENHDIPQDGILVLNDKAIVSTIEFIGDLPRLKEIFFYGVANLTQIKIPANLISLEKISLDGNPNLLTVEIEELPLLKVVSISDNENLKTISVNGIFNSLKEFKVFSNSKLSAFSIPKSLSFRSAELRKIYPASPEAYAKEAAEGILAKFGLSLLKNGVFGLPDDQLEYNRCVASICGESVLDKQAVVFDRIQQCHGDSCKKEEEVGSTRRKKIERSLDELHESSHRLFLTQIQQLELIPTKEEVAKLTPQEKIWIIYNLFIALHTDSSSSKILEMSMQMGGSDLSAVIKDIYSHIEKYSVVVKNRDQHFGVNYSDEKSFSSLSLFIYERLEKSRIELFSKLHASEYSANNERSEAVSESFAQMKSAFFQDLYLDIIQDVELQTKVAALDFPLLISTWTSEKSKLWDKGKVSIIQSMKEKESNFTDEFKKVEKSNFLNSFDKSYASLPKDHGQKRLLQERLKTVLEGVFDKIKSLFSSEIKLFQKLNKVDLILPPTKEEYAINAIFKINRLIQLNKNHGISTVDRFLTLRLLDPAAMKLKNLVTPVQLTHYDEYSDHVIRKATFVSISLPTLFYDDGVSVLSHEIGHIIDANRELLQQPENKDRYTKLVGCLKGLHPEVLAHPIPWTFSGQTLQSGFYWAEDFADLISAKSSHSNVGCQLFGTVQERRLANFPLFSDPHSSILFRLLHVQTVQNGTLTSQCSDYLEKYENNDTAKALQNCWK